MKSSLILAMDHEQAEHLAAAPTSMGPKTLKIYQEIQEILAIEDVALLKNRWVIGGLVLDLQSLASDAGESGSISKVALALGQRSTLTQCKLIRHAYPTEKSMDAICTLRCPAGRPISYCHVSLACQQNLSDKERVSLFKLFTSQGASVRAFKSWIKELLTAPGRKSEEGSDKDYQPSQGGRKPSADATLAPRSLQAASRKATTLLTQAIQARVGIEDAYDKFFEDPESFADSVQYLEVLELTASRIEETEKMLATLKAKNAAALDELRKIQEAESAADRTPEVPAKRQKIQLAHNDSLRDAIAKAKAAASV